MCHWSYRSWKSSNVWRIILRWHGPRSLGVLLKICKCYVQNTFTECWQLVQQGLRKRVFFVTVYDRLWQKTWKDVLSILWLLCGELHTNIWSIWHGSLRLITSFVVDDMLMKHLYEWHEWFACQEMYTRFQEDIIYDTLVDCKSYVRISFHN